MTRPDGQPSPSLPAPTTREARRSGATRIGAAVAMAGVTFAACGSNVPASNGPASNGEAKKPPTQILADAKAATDRTTSVRVSGGVGTGVSATVLDIVVSRAGGGGTITESGQTYRIVVRGSKLYLRADAATWTRAAGAAAARLLANRWIVTSSTNPSFSGLGDVVDISKLTAQLTPSGPLTTGATTTFHGRSAVPLHDRGGSRGTLYVASTGSPYILGVVGGAGRGGLLFTEYGTAGVPPVPARPVDLSQLQRGAGS